MSDRRSEPGPPNYIKALAGVRALSRALVPRLGTEAVATALAFHAGQVAKPKQPDGVIAGAVHLVWGAYLCDRLGNITADAVKDEAVRSFLLNRAAQRVVLVGPRGRTFEIDRRTGHGCGTEPTKGDKAA